MPTPMATRQASHGAPKARPIKISKSRQRSGRISLRSPSRKEMTMSVTDELVRNAEAYAAGFDKGSLPVPPGRKVAVLACMDARLNPYGLLGLQEGDAHVIRNAGGVVTDDEIRSLSISQRLLGTQEIILIHHTDCGMLLVMLARLSSALSRARAVPLAA